VADTGLIQEETSARRWLVLNAAALIYVALLAAISPFLVNVLQRQNLTGGGLMPLGAAAVFFALCAVNALRRRRGKTPFTSPAETLGLFVVVAMGTWSLSWAFLEAQMPLLTAPPVFASPESGWEQYVLPNLPGWAMGPAVEPYASGYYNGLPEGVAMPWGMWLKPVALWSLFMVLLAFFSIGLGSLLSRQWIEHDRLTFPHAEVLMGMVRNFLSDRRFWWGVGVASAVPLWNLVQLLFPVLPKISLLFGSGEKGFIIFENVDGILPLLHISLLGLFYFVHRDIVISMCIFFFVTAWEKYGLSLAGVKLEHEDAFMSGWGNPVGWQTGGAILMLVLFGIWSSRHALLAFFRQAVRGEDREACWFSPRMSLLALVGGLTGIGIWQYALGMRSLMPLLTFLLSIPFWFMGIARITMESALAVDSPMLPNPANLAMLAGGTAALLPVGCVALAITSGWMASWTSQLTNSMQVEKFRSQFKMPRTLLISVLIAVAAATAIGMYSTAYVCYERGANSFANWAYEWHMRIPYDRATEGARTAFGVEPERLSWMGLGVALMGGLIFLRNHVVGWFLHPIGFILAPLGIKPGTTANQFVFTGLLAWGIKTLILKLGGVEGYERLKPFFGGLAVGHFGPEILGLIMHFVAFLVQGRPLGQ
jgi:hypothetical protein